MGFALRLVTFHVVFSAGHAEGGAKGTVYPMLGAKLCTTKFFTQNLSQNQFSSQLKGPQQFENSLSANKGDPFSENNLSTNQHTKER